MIYIDNTIHAGFSYDVAIHAVRNLATSWIKPGSGEDIPESDRTKRKGIYSSQNIAVGPNTTAIMAKTVSRFFQLWFDECVIFAYILHDWTRQKLASCTRVFLRLTFEFSSRFTQYRRENISIWSWS